MWANTVAYKPCVVFHESNNNSTTVIVLRANESRINRPSVANQNAVPNYIIAE